MTNDEENFWDSLSTDEARFGDTIMRDLANEEWARPLLRRPDYLWTLFQHGNQFIDG